jgi:hypothetical protein
MSTKTLFLAIRNRGMTGKAYVTHHPDRVVAALLGGVRVRTYAKRMRVSFADLCKVYREHTTPEQRREARARKRKQSFRYLATLFKPGHAVQNPFPKGAKPKPVAVAKPKPACPEVKDKARARVSAFLASLEAA